MTYVNGGHNVSRAVYLLASLVTAQVVDHESTIHGHLIIRRIGKVHQHPIESSRAGIDFGVSQLGISLVKSFHLLWIFMMSELLRGSQSTSCKVSCLNS